MKHTAITRRVPTVWVRVHMNAPTTRSRTSASRSAKVGRIVDSSGPAGVVTPTARSVSMGWCAAQSPIATNDLAPASTAPSPTARIDARSCCRPRRPRGSGTVLSKSNNLGPVTSSGAGDREVVVREDGFGGCGSPAGRLVSELPSKPHESHPSHRPAGSNHSKRPGQSPTRRSRRGPGPTPHLISCSGEGKCEVARVTPLFCIDGLMCGPLPDRDERPCAREHRTQSDREDRGEVMLSTASPRGSGTSLSRSSNRGPVTTGGVGDEGAGVGEDDIGGCGSPAGRLC